MNEIFHCNVSKNIEANSKFFQLPTGTYRFALAALMRLNIGPFVVSF